MRRTITAVIVTVGFAALTFTTAHAVPPHHGRCQTQMCWHRVHLARRARCARTACAWRHRFNALPATAKYWTRCVTTKESRWRRIARASGFESFFQWSATTWRNAGGSTANAEDASWYEQAVRAWRWHRAHPVGQWPNTGEHGLCGG